MSTNKLTTVIKRMAGKHSQQSHAGGKGGATLKPATLSRADTHKAAVKVETIGFGDSAWKLRKVEFGPDGISGKAIVHPEDFEKIWGIPAGKSKSYVDEQNKQWRVTNDNNESLQFASTGGGTEFVGTVSRNALKG